MPLLHEWTSDDRRYQVLRDTDGGIYTYAVVEDSEDGEVMSLSAAVSLKAQRAAAEEMARLVAENDRLKKEAANLRDLLVDPDYDEMEALKREAEELGIDYGFDDTDLRDYGDGDEFGSFDWL